MNWVTIITHHTHPYGRPKIQIDLDSITSREDHSFGGGVNHFVEADIKRIALDGTERIEKRKTKDWIAVVLATKVVEA